MLKTLRTAGWEWCQLELSGIKSLDLADYDVNVDHLCSSVAVLSCLEYHDVFVDRDAADDLLRWQFCLFCNLLVTVGSVGSFEFHLIASRTSSAGASNISPVPTVIVIEGCCLWGEFQVALAFPLKTRSLW